MQEKYYLQSTHELLSKIESDVSHRNRRLKKSQHRLDRVMMFFFLIIGVIALMNLYFIYNWGQEVRTIVHEMDELYQHVHTMSGQMISMGNSVVQLETETALMPIMNEELNKFVNSMQTMQTQTQNIHHNMIDLNDSFTGISQDVTQMNGQIQGLNQQMNQMNMSVYEMGKSIP